MIENSRGKRPAGMIGQLPAVHFVLVNYIPLWEILMQKVQVKVKVAKPRICFNVHWPKGK